MDDKFAVARTLREIGLLLELKGENRFRARAYETGARALEELREEIPTLLAEHRLTALPGIGPALASVISELATTGRCSQLDRLRQEVPRGALELAELPGLNLKKIQQLAAGLGIDSVASLKTACDTGRLTEVKGFGPKTQQKLLDNIARRERRDERVVLVDALAETEPLAAYLRSHAAVHRLERAGALRRWAETVTDAELVAASPEPETVIEHLLAYPKVVRTVSRRPGAVTVRLSSGLFVALHVVAPSELAAALWRLTGSPEHVARLEALAAMRGVDLDATLELAPADEPKGEPEGESKGESKGGSKDDVEAVERSLYARLGLSYIAPELREDHGEIQAAADGSLPQDLVTLADIRGMTHCHTVYSDGKHTVEEMARAAEAMGMQYLTITDHSPSAHYAGGVQLDRLKRQWDEIARVQERVKIRLLRGTESDILADGALDYPDSILEKLDVIIASIHSRMKMDEDAMTRRLVSAMRLPFFKIWGHALGRLLLRREPFACRVEEVLDAVAESRAAIEINGDPHRLDLAPEWTRRARARGIRFVISTDAHSIHGLCNLRYGVHAARRGWLRRGEVLNTLAAAEFAAVVKPTG
ncbi:MAG: DNA polymerase/3'-5' exonuclease PolX [Polyangia bacterium]